LRPDVQHENGLVRYLPRWFNHSDLKFNSEMLRTVSNWLADHSMTARPEHTRASNSV
jgi:hypothetical protein